MDTSTIIGLSLSTLRMKSGMSQAEVAEKLGIKVPAYQNYEKGRRDPPFDVLIRLSDMYGTSLDYIFGREGYSRSLAEDAVRASETLSLTEKAAITAYMSMPEADRTGMRMLLKRFLYVYDQKYREINEAEHLKKGVKLSFNGKKFRFKVSRQKLAEMAQHSEEIRRSLSKIEQEMGKYEDA